MKQLSIYLLLPIVLLCCYSCDEEKKEIRKLPEESHHGTNTFGCLLNGKAWVGYVNAAWWNGGKKVEIDISNDSITKLTVRGNYRPHPDDGADESIFLSIDNFVGVGIYPLINIPGYESAYYPDLTYPSMNPVVYELTSSTNNYLNITNYDTINKIISGTFEMHVQSHALTHGRFDSVFY